MVSHHLSKFADHCPFGSRDIIDLIFHATLQDHVIKEPCDFMGGRSSLYIPNL